MIVTTKEVENEGLKAFLGRRVTLFCSSYFYTGLLIGVNDTCVKLDNAKVVFDTGAFHTKDWSTAEAIPGKVWYVTIQSIESFGELK